jgi:hypothetical protein
MLSTYDLTLLGSLVSAGGIAFFHRGKWRAIQLTAERREQQARSTALASARWLTVGALTLFMAYAHGEKDGYLFGPWADIIFHIVFVSTCWATTVYRIHQTATRSMTLSLPTRPSN